MQEFFEQTYIRFAGFILYWTIFLINKTMRITPLNDAHYHNLKNKGQNIIFIFWHQASFCLLYLYRGQKACIITSKSMRGEILTSAAQRFGYRMERIEEEGGKTSERMRSLIGILRVLKQGYDTNLAVDGPAGPIYKMKPGAVFLAVKSGLPILPVAVAAKIKITLFSRWDKYFIPFPFSKVVVNFGEPVYLKEDLLEDEYADKISMLEDKLKDLTYEAEEKVNA
ncbi:MAG: DUF374 domain-containing protein [Candidatus Saganbacteria bacterium]|nr:DUF374 domain-containing protein [Candidatus Saganbacteria bacterium]